MSILIKGMEMPQNGELIVVRPDGSAERYARNDIAFLGFPIESKRTIHVPPHGRLIDADAIGIAEHEERFVKRADRGEWMDEYIVGIVDGLHEAGRRVFNAPTIIEAEAEL